MDSGPGTGTVTHSRLGEDFRPFDIADPFDFYARAREEAPVFYSPELDFWIVTRYDDVLAVIRQPLTFSNENAQAPYHPRSPEVERVLRGGLAAGSGLLARQPPDHTRLRAFVNKAFTPRRVAVLEPQIRDVAVSMIDRMAPNGRGDWVAELAYDLPALVIFILLGIPAADVPRVKTWAKSRVSLNFGDLPAEEQVEHAENVVAYWRYCEELVAERFAEPADDLPSDLVRAYEEGDRSISQEEIAGLVFSQLTAGHETTTALLSTSFLELLRKRERWEALCIDSSLIPAAIEELLRLCAPVLAIKRKVKRAAKVGGVSIPEGANLLLMLGSANHDAAVFASPDELDVSRQGGRPSDGRVHPGLRAGGEAPPLKAGRKHLAFGHGIHFCLGAPLARLEVQVVLQELTARLPQARLVESQEIRFPRNTTFRGPISLQVEWGPRPAAG